MVITKQLIQAIEARATALGLDPAVYAKQTAAECAHLVGGQPSQYISEEHIQHANQVLDELIDYMVYTEGDPTPCV